MKRVKDLNSAILINTFFTLGSHLYHNSGEAAFLIEPLDERVDSYLRQTIRHGCRKAKELQSRVKEFVTTRLFNDDDDLPPSIRRRFFPNRRKIKNIMHSVRGEVRRSKIDQENLSHLIEKWERKANIYFTAK